MPKPNTSARGFTADKALDYPHIDDDLWIIWTSNDKKWPDANRMTRYFSTQRRDAMRGYGLYTTTPGKADTFSTEASARAFLDEDQAKRHRPVDVNVTTVAEMRLRCGYDVP